MLSSLSPVSISVCLLFLLLLVVLSGASKPLDSPRRSSSLSGRRDAVGTPRQRECERDRMIEEERCREVHLSEVRRPGKTREASRFP